MSKKLRFAALIRVSSEKQEKRGESLRTQDRQITEAVALMGGEVAVRYAGQEHATQGWERQQLNKLLSDSRKKVKPFDAVIVADPSRWSRDNVASETGLDELRDNGIRFFVLMQEFDLFEPNARAILGLQTTMHAYQAALLAQKSVLNRIAKAQKGELGVGGLPWGRVYNKHAKRLEDRWTLDRAKQKIIQDIAERYIAGEPLEGLAKEYGIHRTTLQRTLAGRCGTEWTQTFESPRFNIKPTPITIKVPPLLDPKTIKAVAKRAEANKTYQHGHLKHRYLFSRMVLCGHCGSALSGQHANGVRYYYHLGQKCFGGVRADDLEAVVVRQLFECFGNAAAVQRAIAEAMPDMERAQAEQNRLTRMSAEIVKIGHGRDRILRFIANGTITNEHAAKQLEELNQREAKLLDDTERIREHLDRLPSPEELKEIGKQIATKMKKSRFVNAKLAARTRHANHAIEEMTWEEKRFLAEMVFGGKTVEGKRMGIYVTRIDGQEARQRKRWTYTIHGHLIQDEGFFPLDQAGLDARFMLGAPSEQKKLITKVRRSSTPR